MRKLLRRLLGVAESPHAIPPWMVWKDQPFFRRAQARHPVPGIPDARCFVLQACLRSIADLPGAVAECGVREGKSAGFMDEACEGRRTLHLFDSFEGLSDPVPGRDTLASAFRSRGDRRLFAVDAEAVTTRLAANPRFRVWRGWIPERFGAVADETFAFVHIDVDLWQPTADSLAFFWPRLVRHGILVCDDYGSAHYPGARAAVDEFFADRPEKPVELPLGQCLVVKR